MEWKTTSTILESLRDRDDLAAWSDLVDHFQAPIVRWGLRLGLSRTDAEDAAQETLAAFARNYKLNRYDRSKGRLKNWLLGIAHRQILVAKRRAATRSRVQLEIGGHYNPDDSSDTFEPSAPVSADEEWWNVEWERNIYERCLEQVRREVSQQTMEIFRLLVSDGLSTTQAAERVGVAPAIVYHAKSRVTKRIADLAKRYMDC